MGFRQRLWARMRRKEYEGKASSWNHPKRMNETNAAWLLAIALCGLPIGLHAQAPEGPMTPQPGVAIQKAPKIKVRTVLVNTPVTVRNEKGEMVNNLEKSDFRITDNGVPQPITHFTLGGDPISVVVVVETSERIGPILPQIRKTGILITQTVTGPTGEGAVVGFDGEVKMLLDFTNSSDAMEKTIVASCGRDPRAQDCSMQCPERWQC